MKLSPSTFLFIVPAAIFFAVGCGSSKSSTSSSAGGSSGSGSSSGASSGGGSSSGSGSSSGTSAGSGSSSGSSSGSGSTACATTPSGTVFSGSNYNAATATCSTHTSGKWTALTIQEPTGAAAQGDAECDAAAPYPDQATFDANEGTSGASGTTITSNHDYVITASCASGSIQYSTTGSAEQKILFTWTKNP